MNDSKNDLSGDGRLTVVIFVLFGLLLFDFTWEYQASFFNGKNNCRSGEQLSFVPPNKLVIVNYSEAGSEQEQVLVPAVYTPFFFELIPINTATPEMLMTVQGIGPALAGDIVAYRAQNGPFKQSKDLQNLKGIGAKRATKFATAFTYNEVP